MNQVDLNLRIESAQRRRDDAPQTIQYNGTAYYLVQRFPAIPNTPLKERC
jgi:hypothetical protein